METLPLISVIVPVYRVEAYLDHCIRSIVEQTYANLEILLVDDGSPDSSGAICDAWAAKDSRIRVLRNEENVFIALARNMAMDQCTGEYLYLIDSDDTAELDMLEKMWELAGMVIDDRR